MRSQTISKMNLTAWCFLLQSKADDYEGRYQTAMKTINQLKTGIHGIFSRIGYGGIGNSWNIPASLVDTLCSDYCVCFICHASIVTHTRVSCMWWHRNLHEYCTIHVVDRNVSHSTVGRVMIYLSDLYTDRSSSSSPTVVRGCAGFAL